MGRRRTLTIDSLERRDLLSITPLINSPTWAPVVRAFATGTGTTAQSANPAIPPETNLTFDPTTGLYTNGNIGGSGITSEVAPPTPNEAARRSFTAKFSGKVLQEPPRLVNQLHQYYFIGGGTSSAFLHGTAQLRYYTPNPNPVTFPDPTNPGATLTEQVHVTTGAISMSDRSTQSGSVILANLVGSPTDVDKLGRPTHFNLTLNGGGGSGGIYASSTGSGTLDIAYKGNKATITVHASIFLSGVGNPYDIYQGVNL
jgi:hypothetical protein